MTPEDEDRMGARIAHAMARSRRHTKFTFTAAAALNWTYEETLRFIDTGEEPAGKEFESEAP